MAEIDSTPEFVAEVYRAMEGKLATVHRRLGRPMTLAEKILLSHLEHPEGQELEPGESYLMLRPDRLAQPDSSAQMAILQFMQSGRKRVEVPTTVHCDHLIQAREEGKSDTQAALVENREVYDFLQSAAAKYGMGFWKPGAGIIHQVVLENYAYPGGLMLGTDSHTPNAGGLGMLAIGVGGADAADVMVGLPWEVKYPTIIGVYLKGEMGGWTAPKDVILHLAGVLTVSGGTNAVIEYFGPGTGSISCTGKATICNMGAELGATCSVFPYDERMGTYLGATGRGALAELASKKRGLLTADEEVEGSPEGYYQRVVEIDLSRLEPQVVGPPHAGPGASHLRHGERSGGEGICGPDLRHVDRELHQLLIRGHESCGGGGGAGAGAGCEGESTLDGDAWVGAGEDDHREGRADGVAGGHRCDGAGQRLRALRRPVEAPGPSGGPAQHHSDLLQPELPPEERWQG